MEDDELMDEPVEDGEDEEDFVGDDGFGAFEEEEARVKSVAAVTASTAASTTVAAAAAAAGTSKTPPGSSRVARAARCSCETLTADDVKSAIEMAIGAVRDITGLDSDTAVILLRRWKWKKDRLIERYVDAPEATLAEAGIVPKTGAPLSSPPAAVCPVCLEKRAAGEMYALACGHWYCTSCWETYATRRLEDAGHSTVVDTHCMFPKCRCAMTESAFSRFLKTDAQRKRFAEASLRAFIDADAHYKWCPGPGCTAVTRAENASSTEPVACAQCGIVYCFVCSDADIGDHRPSPCDQVRKWQDKAADESENIRWLTANTKRCPQCRSPIEKNGGCMHMTCRKESGGCGHEFCWLCRGPWSEHGSATGGFYACNKYDKSTAKQDDMKAADAKSELEHYMFYFHRFDSHKKARAVAIEQCRKVAKREEELVGKFGDVRTADVRFLSEATASLVECRRTLAYSYVYGFYLGKDAPQRSLFEYLQEDLEKYCNMLHGLYEKSLDSIPDFFRWKEEITNCTRVTMKFLENFNAGIASGLTT